MGFQSIYVGNNQGSVTKRITDCIAVDTSENRMAKLPMATSLNVGITDGTEPATQRIQLGTKFANTKCKWGLLFVFFYFSF